MIKIKLNVLTVFVFRSLLPHAARFNMRLFHFKRNFIVCYVVVFMYAISPKNVPQLSKTHVATGFHLR